MNGDDALRAVVLVCTLKPEPAESSSEKLGNEVADALGKHGVSSEVIRVANEHVTFGVTLDEGDGDGWPAIRTRIMAADILVMATPIWMGQPSSVAKMVLERLDAELGEKDDQGRLRTFGKVAAVAVVGNEDGAHHVCAELFQALNDVGFTVAASAGTYWVGEAMQKTDYVDAGPKPDTTGAATRTLATNTAHLARLLQASPYPPADQGSDGDE
jgi:multimeric flavodoxin WrbA